MSYFEEIRSGLKEHIDFVESISINNLNDTSKNKISTHLKSSLSVNNIITKEEPEKLKNVIEYLNNESRFFGWSFPTNKEEEMCEDSFLNLQGKMKSLIGGMTGNERLYYFGFLKEFENLPPNHKSARDEILTKLFMH